MASDLIPVKPNQNVKSRDCCVIFFAKTFKDNNGLTKGGFLDRITVDVGESCCQDRYKDC
jgi:hypothetical protein